MPPKLDWLGAGVGLANVGAGIISTAMANKANKELAHYSFDMQRQMIQEQNAYNSPVQQMARYQVAGLNPSLIYGNGASSAGNQNTIAKYDAPRMEAPQIDLTSAMGMFLQVRRTEAEIKNIEAQTQRYQEDTRAALLRNNWEAFLSGHPVEGWDYKGTWNLKSYEQKYQSQDILNQFNEVRTEFQKLNNKEKDFFIKVLLPLSVELKNLEIQGASYDNIMKAIDSTLWRDKRSAEINATPYRIFGRMVDTVLDNPAPVKKGLKKWTTDKNGKWLYKGKPLFEWHW